ncbi:CMP-N-acetylneuraminate-beta-galactosamide-alpha-2,3-sialyltransferase 1-like [Embiotoca jacksoni]|uniref:CMP-N-acetylneuraminate-beta-galactosamide- alpha-2,3-sialyltransferase 1-like n=1 Tax=Embiotoca jacksoni TaxID=100190 RepID=UPI003704BFA1
MRHKFTARILISLLLCILAFAVFFTSSWNLSVRSLFPRESRLCACDKCLRESTPCVAEIIESSPEPFMSRNTTATEDEFNWWSTLQGNRANFSVFSETLESLFQKIQPISGVTNFSSDRCKTCAVVGNSGNLKGSHYGPLIDSHDFVIRINRGRTEGYEAHVGTRTTHHVMYPESSVKLDNTTYLLFFPFKTRDFYWLNMNLNVNGPTVSRPVASKDKVMILRPGFMRYAHENWLGKTGHYPSTGFLAFAVSTLLCDEVSVFGFGADSDGNWSHYYEILTYKNLKTGGHPGKREYETLRKLGRKKAIQFFKGW